jgi:hypothetical protein
MGGIEIPIIIHINIYFYLVTSITFNNEDTETFIFGCDSGLLYKGSLNSVSSVQSRKIKY